MSILQADANLDLLNVTLRNLDKGKWEDLSFNLQEYLMLPKILKKEKVGFEGGTGVTFRFAYRTSGNAKMTGMYGTDSRVVQNIMTEGYVPWRHATVNFSIDRKEMKMNKGASKIVSLVETRRNDAKVSLAELIETQGWSKPVDSADEEDLWGVPTWIVKNATEGFYGGNPAGFASGVAGIDTATYTMFKNYSGTYAAITKEDLIRKMRKASWKTAFKSPVKASDYNIGFQYGYYTTYDVTAYMEEMLENQNDNLGKDVAKYDGAVLFKKVPVVAVPYLTENDSTNPVYGINWNWFKPFFLEGEYMVDSPFMNNGVSQHTVFTAFTDLSMNFVCRNRRAQFVLYQA